MKKHSRIFALLLTVALIVGAISVIASAATYDASKLNSGSTGIKNSINFTFENGKSGSNYLATDDATKFTALSSSLAAKDSPTGVAETIISASVVAGADGNHYVRYSRGPKAVDSNKYVTFNKMSSTNYVAPNYQYVVYDLDFTSDAYLNAEETDIDPNATSGKLAYPEGSGFGLQGNVAGSYITQAFLCSDENGKWYVGDSSKLSSCDAKVAIADEAGVWNHLTIIFATNGDYYVFVNGEFGWSGHKVKNVAADATIYSNNFNYRTVKGTDTYKRQYSLCVDNLSSNTYDSTYASSDSVYGLDDFIYYGDYVRGIGGVKDVVGNSKNCANVAAPANIFKVGSAEYPYLGMALANIGEGGTVTASSSFEISSISKVYNFNVVCENGAKLTFAGVAKHAYIVTENAEGDKTTYSLLLNPKYTVEGLYEYIVEDFDGGTTIIAQDNTKFANFNIANKVENGNGFSTITAKNKATQASAANALIFTATKGSTTTEKVNQYDRYIVEFDLATGGNYFEGMYISVFDNVNGKYYKIGHLVSNEGKWYFANAATYADASVKYALPETAGEWTHFTMIGYNDTSTSFGIDTYINGEYFGNTVTAHSFRMERLCLYMPANLALDPAEGRDVRLDNVSAIGYGSDEKPYASGELFGIDDYIALGDKTLPLTFLDDITYNSVFSFETPNKPSVNIGTGDYYNLGSAFAALKDGDTITLAEDVKLYALLNSGIKTLKVEGANIVLLGEAAKMYTFEDGVLKKSVSYIANWTNGTDVIFAQTLSTDVAPDPTVISANFGIKGDYKNAAVWEIAFGGSEDFVSLADVEWIELEEGESVTLRPVVGTVAWFEADGTTQVGEVETWFVGEVTPRSFDGLKPLEVLDNGWYEWHYSSWKSADGDFTIENGDHKEFVAVKEYKSAIDAKFNYNLGMMYFATLYLPETPEEVEIVSVIIDKGTRNQIISEGKLASIDGANYTAHSSVALSVYNWYPVTPFEVTFKITDGNGSQTVTTVFETKMSEYVSKVIAMYGCGTVEETLLLNWVQYVAHAYAYMYSTTNELLGAAESVLTSHFTSCPDCKANLYSLSEQTPAEPDTSLTYRSVSELGKGFGATYGLLSNSVRFGAYVPVEFVEANEDLKIAISLRGIANNKTAQKITAELYLYTLIDKDGKEYAPKYTIDGVSSYLYVTDASVIAMYNALEVVTLTYSGNDINKSVTYSLDEYIYNTVASLPEEPALVQTRLVEMLQALKAFSKASLAYKLDGVEIPE